MPRYTRNQEKSRDFCSFGGESSHDRIGSGGGKPEGVGSELKARMVGRTSPREKEMLHQRYNYRPCLPGNEKVYLDV